MDKDEIQKMRKEGWIESWFSIEVMAVSKETVEKSLRDHVAKMEAEQNIAVFEKKFYDVDDVKDPPNGAEKAYSQIVKVSFFAKDLMTIMGVVILYGPSAVEILGPKKKEVEMGEIQNLSNAVAGIMHQFAAAGIGGIVITPEKKK